MDKSAERPNTEVVTHIRGIKVSPRMNTDMNLSMKGHASSPILTMHTLLHAYMYAQSPLVFLFVFQGEQIVCRLLLFRLQLMGRKVDSVHF